MSTGAILNQIFPEPMLPQILVTPIVPFSSVTASNGLITYNGVYNGSVWVIEVDDFGDYSVTAVKADGSGTSEDVVSVTMNKQYGIRIGFSSVLNDNSWADISYISANSLGANLWSIGDAKQITLNGTIGITSYNNYQPWVYILGFNHNASLEGNNLIHFGCFRSAQDYSTTNSIALDDSYYNNRAPETNAFHMNTSDTNVGGWKDSIMRTNVIDADAVSPDSAYSFSFLAALPSDLQAVLKQCTKYTDNVNGATGSVQANITPTQDWAFLLSEYEAGGVIRNSNSYEANYQQQYQYYANGNSKIKYKQSATGTVALWWLRSLVSNASYYMGNFCLMSDNGYTSYTGPQISFGFAPAFCV